jgi:hypothetical protein
MNAPKGKKCRCPNDGALIPLVSVGRAWPKPEVRFFWCHWCGELFAFVGANEAGGRLAASFGYDPEQKTFFLWKTFGIPTDVEIVREALSSLAFSPSE